MDIRHATLLAAAALSLACAGPALASGDGCEPNWGLDFSRMPRCANIPALVPGNDTRANLMLLLADLHGTPAPTTPALQPTMDWKPFRDRLDGKPETDDPTDFADGEGSRCRSNDAGAAGFTAAVQAAPGLDDADRRALTEARAALRPSCAGAPSGLGQAPTGPLTATRPEVPTSGPAGRAFAGYLRATASFYAGDFDAASRGFSALAGAADPWLSDTATYMVARTAVNRMQADAFDQYGTFKGPQAVDRAEADRAEAALDAYLKARPDGRYAASARGLKRRVWWLSGQVERLAASYAGLLALPPSRRGLSDADLAEEIDSKLLPSLKPGMTRDPVLLAVMDLQALREPDKGKQPAPRPDLASQREAFAANPELLSFLEAATAFYEDGDARAVIRDVPDDARRKGGSRLWFSRQFLRGQALEAAGDRNARGFWKELAQATTRPDDRSTAELALALDDERRKDVADAFAPGSPLTNPAIRSILLVNDAGPDLLRARAADASAPAREREVALYTLLRKELLRGQYGAFLTDLRMVPKGASKDGPVVVSPLGEGKVPLGLFTAGATAGDIGCPRLSDTAAALERDPSSPRAGLCLGEWIRLNGLDPENFAQPSEKGDLGTGPSSYPGKDLTRAEIYASVIADRSAPGEDRAYALNRAVRCYEPSGYNHCGGPDVPKAQRRKWYETLRSQYPGSRWARELAYWW